MADRLPRTLKRRYLDYLSKSEFDLNYPGFDFLRRFVVDELSVMRSDCVQTFFRSNEKESLRESRAQGSICVRQATVQSNKIILNLKTLLLRLGVATLSVV